MLVPNLAWGGIGAAGETGEDWGTSPSEINLPVAGEGRLCPKAFWMELRMVQKAGWLPPSRVQEEPTGQRTERDGRGKGSAE